MCCNAIFGRFLVLKTTLPIRIRRFIWQSFARQPLHAHRIVIIIVREMLLPIKYAEAKTLPYLKAVKIILNCCGGGGNDNDEPKRVNVKKKSALMRTTPPIVISKI